VPSHWAFAVPSAEAGEDAGGRGGCAWILWSVRCALVNAAPAKAEHLAPQTMTAPPTRSRRGREVLFGVLFAMLPLLAWLVYSGLLAHGHLRKGPDQFAYFRDLAQSFLQGRLDVPRGPGQNIHDLVDYNGRFYLYWPPVPALVYVPIVLLFGSNIHDALVTATFGAINVALVILLLARLSDRFGLALRPWERLGLVVFWAFGTVHLYVSMLGSVWFVAQVMAQTFLLASILLFLTSRSRMALLASGLCFAAAVYTRNHLVFGFLFFAAIYVATGKRTRWLGDAAVFLLPFLLSSVANLGYNAARFDGRLLENGIQYHRMADSFRASYLSHGYFSLHYFPYNLYTEVFKPMPFSSAYPFFTYQDEGFGLLWASPVFLLAVPVALTLLWSSVRRTGALRPILPPLGRAQRILLAGTAVSTAAIGLLIFTIMGTGRSQFASRYSLDYQFLLLVFVAVAVKLWRGKLLYATFASLLILSIYVQATGVSMFGL
jgi:hypothetical protein